VNQEYSTITPSSRWGFVCQVLILICWAVWWGGLTFYAAVVVPIGTELLGSVDQGFVTQRVTDWNNKLGVLVAAGLIGMGLKWRCRRVLSLGALLAGMVGILIAWHLRLTGMLDFQNQTVPGEFYRAHAVYLWLTTIQWGLGLIVPFLILRRDSM
jgi:hypothetical protein